MDRTQVTYQRDVSHCAVSTYVRDVTIASVVPAVNSDNLDSITFEESGWTAIAKRGMHKPGDVVYFIPPESILPMELADALEINSYLSKGRVRIANLRGNRSEGLIVSKPKVEPYLDTILQWEDIPSAGMTGRAMPVAEIPSIAFAHYPKMPNLLNEVDRFNLGESVWVSEKIHGTSVRFGRHNNPGTGEPALYVGSLNDVFYEDEKSVYWIAVRKHVNEDALPLGVTFYGEVYGKKIQDLHYDSVAGLKVFAGYREGGFISGLELEELCGKFSIPVVKFLAMTYEGIETARMWADSPSTMTASHVREGIVITSAAAGLYKAAKVIGTPYLTRKGQRLERH